MQSVRDLLSKVGYGGGRDVSKEVDMEKTTGKYLRAEEKKEADELLSQQAASSAGCFSCFSYIGDRAKKFFWEKNSIPEHSQSKDNNDMQEVITAMLKAPLVSPQGRPAK